MDIEQIRSVLTSEIKTMPPADLDGNELASVLIIIYGESPFVIMTKKASNPESSCRRDSISWWQMV